MSCIRLAEYNRDVCYAIEQHAAAWKLPIGFFARLIWQESRFDPNAVSPAGAEGIAQFMPGTARLRGLGNAFNPAEALARSAEYLHFLTRKYGNLGLAAAAYNSGEGRISRLTSSGTFVPAETEAYVQIITGHPISQWLTTPPADVDYRLQTEKDFMPACLDLANTRTIRKFELDIKTAEWQPWGVQVGADFSANVASRIFGRVQGKFPKLLGDERAMIVAERNLSFGTRMRYHARVGRPTKAEALQLCQAIQAAGGSCTVVRNK